MIRHAKAKPRSSWQWSGTPSGHRQAAGPGRDPAARGAAARARGDLPGYAASRWCPTPPSTT
ncbi:hypothetical protein QJS66_20060 [Kocuria rhizophila]|nr:hypothetical protein QJS66_20060 [Kocuria rhizophila]